jgi:hypothetical protein
MRPTNLIHVTQLPYQICACISFFFVLSKLNNTKLLILLEIILYFVHYNYLHRRSLTSVCYVAVISPLLHVSAEVIRLERRNYSDMANGY